MTTVASGAVLLGLALTLVTSSVFAQTASELGKHIPIDEGRDFVGEWVFELETPQGTNQTLFEIKEVEGHLVGELGLRGFGDRALEYGKVTDGELTLYMDTEFAGNEQTMELILRREAEELAGDLKSSLFELPIRAITREAAEAAGIVVEREGGGGGDRGPEMSTARAQLGETKLRLRFDNLGPDNPDSSQLDSLAAGEVLRWVHGRPLKLWTDASLDFSGELLPAQNHGPKYPGVYSVWLKRAEGGAWHLVFNQLADVWGTQHQADFDALEVPVTIETLDEPVPLRAEIQTEEGADSARLVIEWAQSRWSTTFRLAG